MKKVFILSLLIFVLASCENNVELPECPTDIACTEEFVILTLTPTEGENPVSLSSYEVVNLDNNEVYSFSNSLMLLPPGHYIGITDAEMDEIRKEGTPLLLRGTKENGQSYELAFEAGHNCCHVIPISGPFAQ